MIVGTCVLKDRRWKRNRFTKVLMNWADDITVKNVFKQFKFAVQNQKTEIASM